MSISVSFSLTWGHPWTSQNCHKEAGNETIGGQRERVPHNGDFFYPDFLKKVILLAGSQ
jgi:hypothetical protein